MRNGLRRVATLRKHWAGIPMPLEGERLVVEPGYPNAQALMAMCGRDEGDDAPDDPALVDAKVRNSFWSVRRRSVIVIFERTDGQIDWGLTPGVHHLAQDLQTLGCAEAWGLEQENTALQLLSTLIDARRYKQYLLTGSFIESSPKSRVAYLFRRLKPTIAIGIKGNTTRIMCALCMHPIGYYEGSWAGAMTPTDDVVAHLMMMRGDEPMFWRRATQHPSWRPEAGV